MRMASRRYSRTSTMVVECSQTQNGSNATTSPSPENLTRFERFTDFPAEIRLLVWKFALPGPRVVLLEPALKSPALRFCYRVRSDILLDDCESFFNGVRDGLSFRALRDLVEAGDIGPMERGNDVYFRSCCPRPVILDVCYEARRVAMMYYKQAFGTVCGFPSVWFDYDVDSLFLDWGDGRVMLDYRPAAFGVEDLKKVRNLVLYERQSRLDSEGYGSTESWVAEVLQSFTGVKRIVRSVFGGDCRHQGEKIVLKEPIPEEVQQYWIAEKINPTDEKDFLGALEAGIFTSIPLDVEKLKTEIQLQARKFGTDSNDLAVPILPNIEYKIAMSSEFDGQLNAGEEQYWTKVEQGEIVRVVEIENA